jgi:hypothetical protein
VLRRRDGSELDDVQENPYTPTGHSDRDNDAGAGEQYAPLEFQFGLAVWIVALMSLVTTIVWAVG